MLSDTVRDYLKHPWIARLSTMTRTTTRTLSPYGTMWTAMTS